MFFYRYLDGKDLSVIQGKLFHSKYYLENGVKVGYKCTSNYGAETIYMIDRDDLGES